MTWWFLFPEGFGAYLRNPQEYFLPASIFGLSTPTSHSVAVVTLSSSIARSHGASEHASKQMNPHGLKHPRPLDQATSEVLEGFEGGFMVSSPVEVAVPEAFCDKIPLQTFWRSAISTERI